MVINGRHTVFLGMAPGVGKTYQMLEEGREEEGRGRDVVIGYLEPHGRAETLAQADGLETLPRRRIEYHGTTLEEMDLPGILRRRPELCLIDELAHTNIPGAEHDHRHEDVDAILKAGIDVWSTVNVQHVESLAGQVAALTGERVSETLPDRVLDRAYNIVLVDLTPELLIERLEAGKIYPDDSVAVARRNFFRPEKLETLREVSLLHVAEEVEPGRRARSSPDVQVHPRPTPSRDRILALATPDPATRPTVHHAYHAARRLTAPFDVLWIPAQDGEAVTRAGERRSRRARASGHDARRHADHPARSRSRRDRGRGGRGPGHDLPRDGPSATQDTARRAYPPPTPVAADARAARRRRADRRPARTRKSRPERCSLAGAGASSRGRASPDRWRVGRA